MLAEAIEQHHSNHWIFSLQNLLSGLWRRALDLQ